MTSVRICVVAFLVALVLGVGSSGAGAETEVPRVGYGSGFYELESLKGDT